MAIHVYLAAFSIGPNRLDASCGSRAPPANPQLELMKSKSRQTYAEVMSILASSTADWTCCGRFLHSQLTRRMIVGGILPDDLKAGDNALTERIEIGDLKHKASNGCVSCPPSLISP